MCVSTYDVNAVRDQFPILKREINGKPLTYLDSAATTQKPLAVIDSIEEFYKMHNANVHRGIYTLSALATARYEAARQSIRNFINASRNYEIIFTRSATESVNLVAHCMGAVEINSGDEIIISSLEHHSNIVPWQMLCQQKQATLRVVPVSDDGVLDQQAYREMLNSKTKMVAIIHVSNVLGIVNPVKEMIAQAHRYDIPVLVDGTQAVPHMSVDVQDLDCDFYVFSGHKMYGPTGIGVLYGKEKWLDRLPPYQYGGDMIKSVTFDKTEFNDLPHKFEAGTPNSVGVIGLEAAIHFLNSLGMDNISHHEASLSQYARKRLLAVDSLNMIGSKESNIGVISFAMDAAHPHDIATILDQHGVAIRAGHHCAMPLMQRLGLAATARVSFGVYSTKEDVDVLISGLDSVNRVFNR